MKPPTAKKVLIIDDEYDLCFLLKSYLRTKNFDVDIANTLSAGIAKINNNEPDIVFLDNNLPDGSGWDKAAEILGNHPGLQMNLITGGSQAKPPLQITQNVNIIEKPLSLFEIDKAVA